MENIVHLPFNILYNFSTFSKNWNHSKGILFLFWFSKALGGQLFLQLKLVETNVLIFEKSSV